jgi:hypothetical protein
MTFCELLQKLQNETGRPETVGAAQWGPPAEVPILQDILSRSLLGNVRPMPRFVSPDNESGQPGRECSHSAATVYGVGYGTWRFAGLSERMMGLEPTTFCMAKAGGRSRPFARVR